MDTVRSVSPDNAHALRLRDLLNLVSNITVRNTRLANANSFLHRLLRRSNEVR